jgi:ecdysteroid 22-hydroxylase
MNPACQQALRDEARALLPSDEVTCGADTLARASYTKAVLKETLRLNPVSVGVGRVLQHDTVFSGYLVPSGVRI